MSNLVDEAKWRVTGCVFAGLAVALGAWAAHGLESSIEGVYGDATKQMFGRDVLAVEKYVGDFRTGVTYQMWHALALLGFAGWRGKLANTGRWLLVIGTVIFSGSLYALVLTGTTWLGAITPIGGVLLLAGWSVLAFAGSHSKTCDDIERTAEP